MKREELYKAIFQRKSVRKYKKEKLTAFELAEIKDFIEGSKKLDPEIKFESKIVSSDNVSSLLPIKAPHYLQFFSEEKGDYLLNTGFILQQLDLYFSANDIGCCWYGLAKPKKEIIAQSDLEYVITLAFGKADEKLHRDSVEEFNRKALAEIKEGREHYEILEAANLAPSATNSQPWYFITQENKIHVYQQNPNFIKKLFYERLNRVDMGIVLSHIWLAAEINNYNFAVKKEEYSPPEIEKYDYLTTVYLK